MKRIIKKITSWIAIDGLLHTLISILITIVCYSFFGFWAVFPTITVGIGKEIYDVLKKPNYTWKMIWHDLICDVGGIIMGMVVSLVIF